MLKKVFALVDCNNFYCACERVFNPRLNGVPVAILSNNDGCVIARSEALKEKGIPMGAPYYQYKHILKKMGAQVLSSNYPLYGDMSHRVMEVLRRFSSDMEIYSIDEAFLNLSQFNDYELFDYLVEIRKTIQRWTGIPVSIGLGPTKTLAKVGNHVAKKRTSSGVFDISPPAVCQQVLASFPVRDVWGIGDRWCQQLKGHGIHTAEALKNMDIPWIRRNLSVVGERLVRELNGLSCLEVTQVQPRKNIISSRSFGQRVKDKESLMQAVANYAAKACEKMRHQKSKAQGISVFLAGCYDAYGQKPSRHSMIHSFVIPTMDTGVIIKAARECLTQLYQPGHEYKKAGVMLLDLLPDEQQQYDFFNEHEPEIRGQLMTLIDNINQVMGKNTVVFGSQGKRHDWAARSKNRTPRYTTHWDELFTVTT